MNHHHDSQDEIASFVDTEDNASLSEVNLDSARARVIQHNIQKYMEDHHVLVDIPLFVNADEVPSIPDNLLSIPLTALLLVHQRFVRYHGFLQESLASATTALKVAERIVDTVCMSMRKTLRGRGMNREEIKEDYETSDIVISANNKKDEAFHQVQVITAELKKVQKEISMLETHIEIRTQRNRNYMEGFPVDSLSHTAFVQHMEHSAPEKNRVPRRPVPRRGKK